MWVFSFPNNKNPPSSSQHALEPVHSSRVRFASRMHLSFLPLSQHQIQQKNTQSLARLFADCFIRSDSAVECGLQWYFRHVESSSRSACGKWNTLGEYKLFLDCGSPFSFCIASAVLLKLVAASYVGISYGILVFRYFFVWSSYGVMS